MTNSLKLFDPKPHRILEAADKKEDVVELDVHGVKRLLLALERKIHNNQLKRVKYSVRRTLTLTLTPKPIPNPDPHLRGSSCGGRFAWPRDGTTRCEDAG